MSSLPMGVVGPPQWSGSLTTQAGPMARPGEMLRPVNDPSDSACAAIAVLAPFVSAVDGSQLVGAGHRQGTITDREAHTFDGSRADVSGRQDARYARLQRARLAVRPRPQAGSE